MNTFRRFMTLMLAIACMTAVASAQEVSIRLVPPPRAIEGQNFVVTYSITNAQVSAPRAPQLTGCTLRYGPGSSTMSSTQIVNDQVSTMVRVDYTYTYHADKAGKVTIPAASITVNGRTYSSQSATFTILPADKSSQQQGGSDVRVDDTRTQTVGNVSPNDLIVKVILSKSSVYEQEPVIATMKLYTKYDISDFSAKVLPKFEGFLSEELPVNDKPGYENLNGQNYYAAVLKRCILYPQKSGTLSINSGTYDVTVIQYENVSMGYFVTRRPVERHVTTSSGSVTLQVKPLPQPAPEGFNGAVGSFTANTSLEPAALKTNEPAILKYTITGTGNVSYLTVPQITFPHGIETLNPQTNIDAKVSGANMTGSYTIDYTLLPQEPGKYNISTGNFVYFDPASAQYNTVELPTFPIYVEQGATVATGIEQKSIDKTMTDIRHIRPSASMPQSKEISRTFNAAWYWIIYAAIAATLVGAICIYRRNIKLRADVTGRRLARASRVANKRLKEARGYMQRHENDKFYEELTRALWGYLSDKLAIPSSQLLRDNVAERLTEYGAGESDIDNIIDIIDQCEMARYTPDHTDSEVAALYDSAVAAINSIENVKKYAK